MIPSEAFKTVARGTLELYLLEMARHGETPEAEAIRDSLDAPMRQLTSEERQLAERVSASLYRARDRHWPYVMEWANRNQKCASLRR